MNMPDMRHLATVVVFTMPVAFASSAVADMATCSRAFEAVLGRDESQARDDWAKALRECRSVADQGAPAAQYNVGLMYTWGKGGPKNEAEAAKWFRRAAEQGHADARFAVGVAYQSGSGVREDQVEAVKWYRLAAEQGQQKAQYNLGVIYQHGKAVAKDYAEAAKWYQRAAEQGQARAQSSLGTMYLDGKGVPQDDAEAIRWFYRAAEQGDPEGQYQLGFMFMQGRAVPRSSGMPTLWPADVPRRWPYPPEVEAGAVRLYRLAAEQGFAPAQRALGASYWSGSVALGGSKDYTQAAKWYGRAAEQGDIMSQYFLGTMYAEGQGVPQDDLLAYFWLNLAAARGPTEAREARDKTAKRLTLEQRARAQEMARNWKPKPEL
jgi:TPR repeat protein